MEGASCTGEGWKGYVLKEKLKGIKSKLKEWNREHCGNLEEQILKAKEVIARIDLKSEVGVLSVEEVDERRLCVQKIFRLTSLKCSLLWQKSRIKWLKEGDANSKFFHRCIQKRRKINELLSLNFDGVFVEGLDPLRDKIRGYFENHFMGNEWARPFFGNVNFPSLGEAENILLTVQFSEEEIKAAVWDCGSYKSPGPDGVTFAFIK